MLKDDIDLMVSLIRESTYGGEYARAMGRIKDFVEAQNTAHNSAMLEIALVLRSCLEGRGVGCPLRDNKYTAQRLDAVIAQLQQ